MSILFHINERFITYIYAYVCVCIYMHLFSKHFKNSSYFLYIRVGVWKSQMCCWFFHFPFPVHSRNTLAGVHLFQPLIHKRSLERGKRKIACLSPLWDILRIFSITGMIFVLKLGNECQMGKSTPSSSYYLLSSPGSSKLNIFDQIVFPNKTSMFRDSSCLCYLFIGHSLFLHGNVELECPTSRAV